jgi:putative cell wall-binding protein
VVSDAVLAALQPFAPGGATRFAGVDRFETAAAISRGIFAGTASTAYVVSGYGLADALSAGPAAARDHAPVLLATLDRLPEPTRIELARLAPAKVVIVGGTGVVGPAVDAAIASALPGVTIQRLAGPDRYATAAAVGATFAHGPLSLYVASGMSFADAPGAAAAAGYRGVPLLLSSAVALPAVTRSTIETLAPARALVIGGPAALFDAVLVAIRSAVAVAS